MRSRIVILSILAALLGCGTCLAQSADNRTSPYGKGPEEERPLNLLESMAKMRIDKEKKEYEKMLGRGEEALKIAEDLEKAYENNGRLTDAEVAKLAAVEKLAKQIRNDLGGGDDESGSSGEKVEPVSHAVAVKSLRSTAEDLFQQLKKTTRFTISAAAIQSSNAVLRLSRLLRFSN
jgi:hypothetical protein